jgi:leucyl-tRNA synthetase
MEGLKMLYSDDPTADEKIREDCVPGAPHVSFYYQAGVDMAFINPQPHSGLFEAKLPVMPGDTPLKLAIRIVKHHRQIKGADI